jgi:hypothetical protein
MSMTTTHGGRPLIGKSHRQVVGSFFNLNSTLLTCSTVSSVQVSEETVLTDPTGFHLGAGPYMLIYSRAVPEQDQGPLPWPEEVVVRAPLDPLSAYPYNFPIALRRTQ